MSTLWLLHNFDIAYVVGTLSITILELFRDNFPLLVVYIACLHMFGIVYGFASELCCLFVIIYLFICCGSFMYFPFVFLHLDILGYVLLMEILNMESLSTTYGGEGFYDCDAGVTEVTDVTVTPTVEEPPALLPFAPSGDGAPRGSVAIYYDNTDEDYVSRRDVFELVGTKLVSSSFSRDGSAMENLDIRAMIELEGFGPVF